MLLTPKFDGLSDGQNTFQGVRTYGPQAGVWTTPDAYHGAVQRRDDLYTRNARAPDQRRTRASLDGLMATRVLCVVKSRTSREWRGPVR